MKVTYYFNDNVKSLIKDGINTFIVDDVLGLGEDFVGYNTPTLLEEYKIRVQKLKNFSKWILKDAARYNVDTDSDNFTFLYSLMVYLWNSDMYDTHNLPFLRVLQAVIRDNILVTRDNGGDTQHIRYILDMVDEEVRNFEDNEE